MGKKKKKYPSYAKNEDQRVGMFVDVQNLYYTARNLFKGHVNFAEVLEVGIEGRKLIRAIAYVIKASVSQEKNFFVALEKMGFEIRAKDLQVFPGGMKKGDWDIGLSLDSIKMSPKLDVVVIVSGDGDYCDLVEYLKVHGQRVEIIAFGSTTSKKLLEVADDFIDLEKDLKRFILK